MTKSLARAKSADGGRCGTLGLEEECMARYAGGCR